MRRGAADSRASVRRTVSRLAGSLLPAMALLPLLACLADAQMNTEEYRAKATFLATFPSFVEWRQEAFAEPAAPFLVCVVGDFRFGTSLAELTRNSSAHKRRVEVRWIHKDAELRKCHILFVSRSESHRYTKLLQSIQGADVLTVGETTDFLSAGGALSFYFEDRSLQFEVNLLAMNEAHLHVSSRLLALARRVVGKTEAAKG